MVFLLSLLFASVISFGNLNKSVWIKKQEYVCRYFTDTDFHQTVEFILVEKPLHQVYTMWITLD